MTKPQPRGDAEIKKNSAPPRLRGSLFRERLLGWFEKNGRDLPWRRTRDPYAILVSEFMLQQTQVATVIPFYERWMKRFPNVKTLAKADEQDVLSQWQGLGYYSRARNLHRAARQIVERRGSRFPRLLEEIRALPGVGRYTAGAVATFAFDEAMPIVEANIARVLARMTDLQTPIDSRAGSDALWEIAAGLQQPQDARLFNSALMELGALVCTARAPKCGECPAHGFCLAQRPEELPRKKARPRVIALIENCAWVIERGKILLELQTGSRWSGLWKLPPVVPPPRAKPMVQLTYPFTHHRVALSVFKTSERSAMANEAWHSLQQIPAMPSPHRRALEAMLRAG